ncbi:MAG: carbohydrate ABC transporter permease [Faecousia sp.]
MKKNKFVIFCFVFPSAVALLLTYLYPVCRTLAMSLFQMDSVTANVSTWRFVGFENFAGLFGSKVFRRALLNVLKIWLVGGVITLSLSLLFAVILTSGIRFKKFFRAAIYLPNIISAVALSTMWIQYVYNRDFGLLNQIIGLFGGKAVKWLGADMKFWSMLAAFIFGAVGYYMLIFISGIEQIPHDLYEAATIDGAGKVEQFKSITMPLLKKIVKTSITFWTINAAGFFLWTKMFSPISSETSTIVPVSYLYDIVFGVANSNTPGDPAAGAAIGVLLALVILGTYLIMNRVFKDEELEF